jgi:hypothetical protein
LILIKINQCTDENELMKKQIKKLKEDIDTLGNGFSRLKTDSKQEIEEDLNTRFDGIII